ncbi:N-formylglutamate amidohydrolase [soil metagenome]
MSGGLLGPHDPPTVSLINPSAASVFLLLGDHAGQAIPSSLGDLGLTAADQDRHIAWDIGVRALGEALSEALDATFIVQTWSRLVIDCNRDPAAADAIPVVSDGTLIPGNVDLGEIDRRRRIDEVHEPYHRAIADVLTERAGRNQPTILVSLHSFTPVMNAFVRPWEIGVLHDRGEAGFAQAMLTALRAELDLVVGDNEPYRMDTVDHTVPRHAYPAALPYVELEIRQDLIHQPRWIDILKTALNTSSGRT